MESATGVSRSVGMDAIFQYTGSGVQLFSGMVFYIVITRLFSIANVGAIALFVAIVGLFNVIFSFGLGTAAQHFTSYNLGKGDYAAVKKTIYKILGFGFAFSMIGFAFLILMSTDIAVLFLHSDSYDILIRVLAIVLLGNILFGILNGALLGIQNFRLSAIINIVIWISYYFGSILFAVFLRSLDTIVFGWMIGIFLGVAIELIVVVSSIRKYGGPGTSPSNSFLFAYSLPVLFSGLITYGATYADRFIVSGLMSLASLGVYNFALLIASSIGFIVFPLNNILMPKFSELFGKGKRQEISSIVTVTSTLLYSIYVPAALGIAAIAPILLKLLAGTPYVEGTTALRIIMVFSAIFISQNILAQALAAIRKTRIFLISSASAFGSNVLFSLLLIPHFGIIGGALGFSTVYIATFTVLYMFAKKEQVASFEVKGIAKVWISSAVMFGSVFFLRDMLGSSSFYLPLYVLLGVLIYLLSARSIKLFKNENKELVLSLFPPNYKKLRWVISFFVLH